MIAATPCSRLRVVVVETTRTWEGGHHRVRVRITVHPRLGYRSTWWCAAPLGLHRRRLALTSGTDGTPFLSPEPPNHFGDGPLVSTKVGLRRTLHHRAAVLDRRAVA